MATKPRPKAASQPSAQDLEAVGQSVEQALPGVAILDHGLVFDEAARADLAGVDAAGRLVLVRLAGEDADASSLGLLDLLGYAHRHVALIARHLDTPRVVPTLEPRLVVVMEPGDALLAERLSPLSGRGLELLELRSVKSRAGERAYLVPVGGDAESVVASANGGVERFLDGLEGDRQELGRLLCSRMARLDDELRVEAGPDSVAWFFQDHLLVRLDARGGHLLAAVGNRGNARAIGSTRDADELLEDALSRLVEEVGQMPAEDVPGAYLQAQEGEPLLTEEEIEAFREG